jgi:hypothetical protein
VPFYDMTLSVTKSVSMVRAGHLSAAAAAEREGRAAEAVQLRARAGAITDALQHP